MSNWKNSNILINDEPCRQLTFAGGEIQIRLPEPVGYLQTVRVTAVIKSSDDLIALMLVTDALHRKNISVNETGLVVPYFPYARQDRVCFEGEAFSAAVAAKLINALGYRYVVVYDPHSDVTTALLENCRVFEAAEFIRHIPDVSNYAFVAPDAGATRRVELAAQTIDNRGVIQCLKHRDPDTGYLSNPTICTPEAVKGQDCLIVDDICDGGRTFTMLAKVLRDAGAARVSLYVTHGIFSQGPEVFRGLIDEVYHTNSLLQAPNKSTNALLSFSL